MTGSPPAPREPLRRRRQYAPQAFGDVGDLEELGRRGVVALSVTRVDGEEVGGEFGLPGPVLDHVLMRQGDLDPGLQRLAASRLGALGRRRQVELRRGGRNRDWRRRGWRRCGDAGAALRVIGGFQLGLERLRGLEQRREFHEGVQVAQRVRVAQRQVEMGDSIASVERLREEPSRLVHGLALELVAEHLLPVVEHSFEQAVDVERIVRLLAGRAAGVVEPSPAMAGLHVSFDETVQHGLQGEVERVANPLGALDVPGHDPPPQNWNASCASLARAVETAEAAMSSSFAHSCASSLYTSASSLRPLRVAISNRR